MALKAAAASTHAAATEAATQAFHLEAGDAPATAIDAALAGVLALAARHPGVLLGAGSILLGGTGEGQLAIDARPRQPGIGSPRPRGFTDVASIPDAARIAAPLLPAALTLAHAGRGTRTRTALLRVGLAAASASAKVDDARVESLKGFGREGAGILRGGAIREALLAASARSVGGTLTREDLDALRADVSGANVLDREARRWAVTPWSRVGDDDATPPTTEGGELAVVAASDSRGAVAVIAVWLPTFTVALPDVGLAVPLLGKPVLRGVARVAAGTAIELPSPIAIAQGRTLNEGRAELGGVDLALGVGGGGDVERALTAVVRATTATTPIDDAIASAGEHALAGVLIDSRGRGRALTHNVR